MVTNVCCPAFAVKSVTCIFALAQAVLYILMLLLDTNTHAFLEPSDTILNVFGSKDAYKLRYEGEIWRLFLPCLLVGSLFHLV
jgi:hypothetical protein